MGHSRHPSPTVNTHTPRLTFTMAKLLFCTLACLVAMAVAEHHIRDLAGQINNQIFKRATDIAKKSASISLREASENLIKRAEELSHVKRACDFMAVSACMQDLQAQGQPTTQPAMCTMLGQSIACFSNGGCKDADLAAIGMTDMKQMMVDQQKMLNC